MDVIIKLTGGLGNQMFQYAYARSIAIKNKCELYIDDTYYTNQPSADTIRKLELTQFHIQDFKYASVHQRKNMRIYAWFIKIKRRLGVLGRLFPLPKNIVTPDCPNDITHDKYENYYIGHFQTHANAIKISQQLRSHFILNDKMLKLAHSTSLYRDIDDFCGTVALHIRRGDYVSNANASKHHGVMKLNYYYKALSYLTQNKKITKIIVFSDDIEWVRNNLYIDNDVLYYSSEYGQEYASVDLYLMSLCNHFIIANSSYSWWAAWLGRFDDKIVIAPGQWNNYNTHSPVLDEWIKIYE